MQQAVSNERISCYNVSYPVWVKFVRKTETTFFPPQIGGCSHDCRACELTSKGYCINKRRQRIDSVIHCPTTLNCRRIDRADVNVVCKVILHFLRKSPHILTRAWNIAIVFLWSIIPITPRCLVYLDVVICNPVQNVGHILGIF